MEESIYVCEYEERAEQEKMGGSTWWENLITAPKMLFDYFAGDFVVSECFKIHQKLVEIIVILTYYNAISKVYLRLTSHLIV